MAPLVVLVGPPGAGKTTVGRKLAYHLRVPLIDTDVCIEQQAGQSIPEIFATEGEASFRAREENVIAQCLQETTGVLSLGGGAVLSARTRSLLQQHCVVFLDVTVEGGLRRVSWTDDRPLLTGKGRRQRYRALLQERKPLYQQVADYTVQTTHQSSGRIAQQICALLCSATQQDSATT